MSSKTQKAPTFEEAVKSAYLREFWRTGDKIKAYNAVLDAVGGRMKRRIGKEKHAFRMRVADELRKIMDDIPVKLRQQVQSPTVTLDVHGLDVWGNEKDGFMVNDIYASRGKITIPRDPSNKEVVAALKKANLIEKHIQNRALELDDNLVKDARTGEPIFELRTAHGRSWPH